MTFQGSLAELPLPDIIQLVSVSGKTGRFDLSNQGARGQIFLREGQIVHATTESLQGEEAVYQLAIWSAGDFVFTPEGASEKTTIDKSNTNLLMEAARRIDEWQILSKRIASTDLVPVFTEDTINTSVSFTPIEWAIICKIDERRTIDEIAAVLGMSPFETCKQLYGLVTSGLVALRKDLVRFFGPRLRQCSDAQLRSTAVRLAELYRTALTHHPKRQDLEVALRLASSALANGLGPDAVLDLLRAADRIASAGLGPDTASELAEGARAVVE